MLDGNGKQCGLGSNAVVLTMNDHHYRTPQLAFLTFVWQNNCPCFTLQKLDQVQPPNRTKSYPARWVTSNKVCDHACIGEVPLPKQSPVCMPYHLNHYSDSFLCCLKNVFLSTILKEK